MKNRPCWCSCSFSGSCTCIIAKLPCLPLQRFRLLLNTSTALNYRSSMVTRSPSCSLCPRTGAIIQGVFLKTSVVAEVLLSSPGSLLWPPLPDSFCKGFLRSDPELPPATAAQCFSCCPWTTCRQSSSHFSYFSQKAVLMCNLPLCKMGQPSLMSASFWLLWSLHIEFCFLDI